MPPAHPGQPFGVAALEAYRGALLVVRHDGLQLDLGLRLDPAEHLSPHRLSE